VDLLKSNDVNYLGRVDDLGSIYLRSKVVIAPLLTGRGRKGKIGEALSWGTPVVTTSVGAEGFDFKNGVDAFIADDAGIFAEYVLSLMGNQELWEASSINAYKYADKNLSSSQFLMQIRKILETAMG
jgi:glycosyltransferase involved in cell wall biosynthesis